MTEFLEQEEFRLNTNVARASYSTHKPRILVIQELIRFTFLTRDIRDFLVDRYSERKELKIKVDLKKM